MSLGPLANIRDMYIPSLCLLGYPPFTWDSEYGKIWCIDVNEDAGRASGPSMRSSMRSYLIWMRSRQVGPSLRSRWYIYIRTSRRILTIRSLRDDTAIFW